MTVTTPRRRARLGEDDRGDRTGDKQGQQHDRERLRPDRIVLDVVGRPEMAAADGWLPAGYEVESGIAGRTAGSRTAKAARGIARHRDKRSGQQEPGEDERGWAEPAAKSPKLHRTEPSTAVPDRVSRIRTIDTVNAGRN
jgi:hypothetical protein